MNLDVIWLGSVASLLAGLATGAGALPVLFTRKVSDRLLDVMLGFSAGVMLAATFFSLLAPAIDLGGVWVAMFGIIFGAVALHLADRFIPHFHPALGTEGPSSRLSRVWLFALAITIHNFPEGLAVGVSFGSGDVTAGLVVAMAIGLQNMPEGLAVALPLLREGYSRQRAVWYGTLTGLIEPVGGLLGVALVSISHPILPWALAFAAGAMLFVVSDEIIPESHRKGFERQATFGLIIGFIVMMLLDYIFT
ncbi:MAG: ZIP family metal transporter [Candidatus Bathyarchaeia archaeon]|jgi:ZIP family zinc transporter|nr:ZIP family metal transporter [Candidatus Bathyarchaeota archaeon A05DMB-4]MDH7596041.1 ZIP family metal transporter [Candidatus Bathyarchaeota archaeon]